MHLGSLSLTNFKNYEESEFDFSKRINCIVGDNGVGKTNILDAIHYLSLTKSFFNNIDSLNIRHEAEFFIIKGTFGLNGGEESISCSFQRQKQKILKRNGKDYSRLSDHVGRFPVVMISPSDSCLITEGSEERRKFMNKIISQFDPVYLDSILKYNKALQQRNRLLKSFKSGSPYDEQALRVWDMQLVRYGEYVYETRKYLIETMIPVFQKYYGMISSGNETVKMSYRSTLNESDFAEALKESLTKDMYLEYTTVGVHKDDLILEMDGYPVKSIGSQGQQKSYLTALKLAKYDYIKGKSTVLPILLLDDIFDKFDGNRVEQIIKIVMSDDFGQIFITDTHQDRLSRILDNAGAKYKLFVVLHIIKNEDEGK
jgi:DNA replication and repair protein RecF